MTGGYDREQIIEDVESIIRYSQQYPFPVDRADVLIDQWEDAKLPFIKLFDGKTRIRSKKKITIYFTVEEQQKLFSHFLQDLNELEVLTDDLENFLLNNQGGFFKNEVFEPYPKYNIKRGEKISKSLKKFIEDRQLMRASQDIASRYIQDQRIEGFLYLSVDPRDFLTISENNANWRSCHALSSDYRAGNLSYMVDNSTIVAYLTNGKDEKLSCCPSLKWNSKKWRMLIHTDRENCIYFNRPYPFSSNGLLLEAYDMINDLLGKGFAAPTGKFAYNMVKINGEERNFNHTQLTLYGRSFDSRDIIHTDDYKGYRDLIESSNYTPIISLKENKMLKYMHKYAYDIGDTDFLTECHDFMDLFGITIGGKALCPVCGCGYVEQTDKLICNSCISENEAEGDYFDACDECGAAIYNKEDVYTINGYTYCKKCYNRI